MPFLQAQISPWAQAFLDNFGPSYRQGTEHYYQQRRDTVQNAFEQQRIDIEKQRAQQSAGQWSQEFTLHQNAQAQQKAYQDAQIEDRKADNFRANTQMMGAGISKAVGWAGDAAKYLGTEADKYAQRQIEETRLKETNRHNTENEQIAKDAAAARQKAAQNNINPGVISAAKAQMDLANKDAAQFFDTAKDPLTGGMRSTFKPGYGDYFKSAGPETTGWKAGQYDAAGYINTDQNMAAAGWGQWHEATPSGQRGHVADPEIAQRQQAYQQAAAQAAAAKALYEQLLQQKTAQDQQANQDAGVGDPSQPQTGNAPATSGQPGQEMTQGAGQYYLGQKIATPMGTFVVTGFEANGEPIGDIYADQAQ